MNRAWSERIVEFSKTRKGKNIKFDPSLFNNGGLSWTQENIRSLKQQSKSLREALANCVEYIKKKKEDITTRLKQRKARKKDASSSTIIQD